MNPIVCSVTLIYLCLGNVAVSVSENIEHFDSSVRNWNFTCVSKHHRDHQWFHVYPNGNRQQPTYIGNIPTQTNVETTKFNIKLETFDNNTEVKCDEILYVNTSGSDYFTKTVSYRSSIILIGSDEILKYSKEPAILEYNERQKVSFKCEEYVDNTNLVIGVINTTSNMIETYNYTFLDTIFDKSDNGTVLCCIYYEVIRIVSESWITRHVAKKTLLVYEEPVTVPVTDRQDSSEDKVREKKSSNSTDVVMGNQDANPGNQDANQGNQVADSANQDPGSIIEATIICTVSAVAVVFILLAVSVIYLKRCRKKPKVEVEAKVLYADLDFLRRNEPESLPREGPQEESPYAQIIGELRPQCT